MNNKIFIARLITAVLLSVPLISQALTTDKFSCTLSVTDLKSKISTKAEKDLFIARLPMSASPSPDVRVTGGDISESLVLDLGSIQLSGELNFYFKHAIKMGLNGQPLEARQLTCMSLAGSYCDKTKGDGDFVICSRSYLTCAEPADPFEPNNGWAIADLINGIPSFNEQTLGPATYNISNDSGVVVGVANVICRYKGTYQ